MRSLFSVLFFSKLLFAGPLTIDVKAEGAVLINAETGVVLFEKNGAQVFYPASITKIATALFALKQVGHDVSQLVEAKQEALVSLSEEAKKKSHYTTPAYWLVPGGTHIGIKTGEVLTLSDLLHGMMIASGNDAANVIATHVSGSVPKFMEELNQYLKQIGCQNTSFCNPHGLYHPNHQCSPLDMALIAKEAMKSPLFRQIVSTVKYQRPKTNKQEATTLLQTNKLLRQGPYYNPKAIGVKTGYIANASHNFVAAAEHEGRTLIAVLMKTKEREDIFKDSNKLFEKAFSEEKLKAVFLKKGVLNYELMLDGARSPLTPSLLEDLVYEYYPAEQEPLKATLFWNETIKPPVLEGDLVGKIELKTMSGRLIKSLPLVSSSFVDLSFKRKIIPFLKPGLFAFLTLIFLIGCCTVLKTHLEKAPRGGSWDSL
jgi:D-alanyl-D-alanine carboxypeptidase (penicillin-binding protein 5/6)